MSTHAIVLLGHGGLPHDAPRQLVVELKPRRRATCARRARAQRARAGKRSDTPHLAQRALHVAYDEFCAPSVEDVIDRLTHDGITRASPCARP
jgi:hypothetical protein